MVLLLLIKQLLVADNGAPPENDILQGSADLRDRLETRELALELFRQILAKNLFGGACQTRRNLTVSKGCGIDVTAGTGLRLHTTSQPTPKGRISEHRKLCFLDHHQRDTCWRRDPFRTAARSPERQ
jgi:hypothetical protein